MVYHVRVYIIEKAELQDNPIFCWLLYAADQEGAGGMDDLILVRQDFLASAIIVRVVWDGVVPFGVNLLGSFGSALENIEICIRGSHTCFGFVFCHYI